MLGGMSGGGMAMFVAPERRDTFVEDIHQIMLTTKQELQDYASFRRSIRLFTISRLTNMAPPRLSISVMKL